MSTDLNATLASIEAEVKKLPKYDLKRKSELHQKGFLLIPSLRQAYVDEYGGYEEKLQQITIESKTLKESLTEVNDKYKMSVAQVASLSTHLDNVQQELKLKQEECRRLTQTVEKLNNEIQDHLKTIDEKDAEIRENETIRRKLHNEVQELKGNIRVYCRVRPLLNGEDNQGHDLPVIFDDQCDKNIRIQHDNTNEVSHSLLFCIVIHVYAT